MERRESCRVARTAAGWSATDMAAATPNTDTTVGAGRIWGERTTTAAARTRGRIADITTTGSDTTGMFPAFIMVRAFMGGRTTPGRCRSLSAGAGEGRPGTATMVATSHRLLCIPTRPCG